MSAILTRINRNCQNFHCVQPRSEHFGDIYHKFEIEIGRYHRPKRKPDERLCQVCDATEDEMHCLMSCKLNQDLRFRFFEETTKRYPSFQHMDVKDRFIFIMKHQNLVVVNSHMILQTNVYQTLTKIKTRQKILSNSCISL